MRERAAAIGSIIASCPNYRREEVADLLDEWAETKGMDFHAYVPDDEVDEIIETLREESRHAA